MKRIVLSALVLLILAPVAITAAPRPAHAQFGGIGGIVLDPTNLVQNTISAVANPLTAAATTWTEIKGAVLDPLARALAQAVLKEVTASVVNSINGKNGSPQFVTNLSLNLQQVGDQVGLSFISQFGSSINSPFSAAIASALRTNYLQSSSLAGFFAANQCTLAATSPNINSFLSGNFNQGGWSSWFALTTQDQNNPFTLYQKASGQLASVVSGAQANQRSTIQANQGFLSWCSAGPSESNTSSIGKSCSDFANSSDCSGNAVCIQTGGGTSGICQAPTAATSDDTASTCYNSDGTPGTVQTPGSVIAASLNKATGSGIDDLISVHDFDEAVSTILSAVVTNVVSSGLTALSSGGSSSITSQLTSGTSATDPNTASIAANATAQAQAEITQLASYTSTWQTIQSAANNASAVLTQAQSACGGTYSASAQSAILTQVQPVLTQAQAAIASAATTKTLAVQVETDATNLTAGTAGAAGAIVADTQALSAAPPSVSDVAAAQAGAAVTGAATSSPSGSLTVSGGTIVDRMNLLSQNAQALQNSCARSDFSS